MFCFLLRNIQPFQNGIGFILVFEWSSANHWQTYTRSDVIVCPGSSLQSPSGSAGLGGINLKIYVMESAPFTMFVPDLEPNSTKLIGYIPDLIDVLREQIGLVPQII